MKWVQGGIGSKSFQKGLIRGLILGVKGAQSDPIETRESKVALEGQRGSKGIFWAPCVSKEVFRNPRY